LICQGRRDRGEEKREDKLGEQRGEREEREESQLQV